MAPTPTTTKTIATKVAATKGSKTNVLIVKSTKGTKTTKKTTKTTKTTRDNEGRVGGRKRRRKSINNEGFSRYLYRVLKQVHPDTKISTTAMSIMNSFVNDIFERIAKEASRLVAYKSRSASVSKATLSIRDVQAATQLLLPGELSKHSVSEGTKSVTKYANSQNQKWWKIKIKPSHSDFVLS